MRCHRTLRTKRLLDISLSLTGLVLSAPLWPLIAAAIKLEDGGPVFYGQERVGRGGTRFKNWKFRSMTPNTGGEFSLLDAENKYKTVTTRRRIPRATSKDEFAPHRDILQGARELSGAPRIR